MTLNVAKFCDTCGVLFWPDLVDDNDTCQSCLHHDAGDGEPEEGDYITEDHEHFYQHGKLALVVYEDERWAHKLKARMDRERFWPNTWFVSDHGNAHLIDMLDALGGEDDDA